MTHSSSSKLQRLLSAVALAAICLACVIAFRLRTKEPKVCSRIGRMCEQTLGGLSIYNSVYKKLPADSPAPGLNSWRFQLQRLVEDVHNQPYELQASWKGPENKRMREHKNGPACFTDENSVAPLVCAVTGPGTCWSAEPPAALADLPPHYIFLVGGVSSSSHWMEPGDIDSKDFVKVASGVESSRLICATRIWACFADGEVWILQTPIPEKILEPFVQMSSAVDASRDALMPYRVNAHE